MKRRLCLLLLAWLGCSAAVGAETIQSLESIQEAVRTFLLDETASLQGDVRVQPGRLDNRLRLDRCERPLEVYWPDGGRRVGSVSVGVRCYSPSWTIFVRAAVEVHEAIWVSRRPLSRGTILGSDDLELSSQNITRLSAGYYGEKESLLGAMLTRSIVAGTVITPTMITLPAAVRRGERVTIQAGAGGIQVRMEGEALSDGAVGDLIRVRNLSSQQIIEAEVVAPGQVQVRM